MVFAAAAELNNQWLEAERRYLDLDAEQVEEQEDEE